MSLIQYNVELGATRSCGAEDDNYWILKSNLCSGLSSGGCDDDHQQAGRCNFHHIHHQAPSHHLGYLIITRTNWPHFSTKVGSDLLLGCRICGLSVIVVVVGWLVYFKPSGKLPTRTGRWSLKCNDWLSSQNSINSLCLIFVYTALQ